MHHKDGMARGDDLRVMQGLSSSTAISPHKHAMAAVKLETSESADAAVLGDHIISQIRQDIHEGKSRNLVIISVLSFASKFKKGALSKCIPHFIAPPPQEHVIPRGLVQNMPKCIILFSWRGRTLLRACKTSGIFHMISSY